MPRRGFRSVLRSSGNAARSRVLPGNFVGSHAPSRVRSSLSLEATPHNEPRIRRDDRSWGAATRSWRESGDGPAAQCAAPEWGRTSPARTAFSCKPLRSGRSRMGEKYVLDGRLSPRPTPSDSEAAMAAHDGMPILKMAGTICSLAKPDSVPRTTPPLCQDAGAGQGSACRPRPGQVRPQVRRRTG